MAEVRWTPGMTVAELERQAIFAALEHYHGNKTATANSLGVSVKTIDNKLARYKQDEQKAASLGEQARQDREDFIARCRGTVVKTADGHDTLASVNPEEPPAEPEPPQANPNPKKKAKRG